MDMSLLDMSLLNMSLLDMSLLEMSNRGMFNRDISNRDLFYHTYKHSRESLDIQGFNHIFHEFSKSLAIQCPLIIS